MATCENRRRYADTKKSLTIVRNILEDCAQHPHCPPDLRDFYWREVERYNRKIAQFDGLVAEDEVVPMTVEDFDRIKQHFDGSNEGET